MNVKNNVSFYRPIIIIGAARSGTNMLRDVLTQLPGFGTWPCDEINYIWRHGNPREVTDEFSPELATEEIQSFIRTAFDQLAKKQALSYVVEKTCANSLRVAFVNQVLPNAKFIFIVRDGRDVVASAQKRWVASLDIPYILRKARFVPPQDIPYYASQYLWNRVYRLLSREHRLAFWGPRFEGMTKALEQYSLPEVCALQWQRCLKIAEHDLNQIESTRIHQLRYEDFVANPIKELSRISTFLKVDISAQYSQKLIQGISTDSVGRWKKDLNQNTLKLIQPLIQDTLKHYGYL
ncbi:sulfotransferase family protein [Coleofasciculus sp. E2-BRE-01]|uniref:sulfotransferase family protein n=1 Tax=Coleofasciculus sp. E2-BRE-01 TaxID=3069524 RepID=UPI0032FD5E38